MITFANFAFFIGGIILGGIIVNYFQKKQLQQLADMLKTHDKKDPADWWKDGEDQDK